MPIRDIRLLICLTSREGCIRRINHLQGRGARSSITLQLLDRPNRDGKDIAAGPYMGLELPEQTSKL
jgi:hypothetical protein